MKKPSFTAKTWHGNSANEFDQFRNEQLGGAYLNLGNMRMSFIIKEVRNKIDDLKTLSASDATEIHRISIKLADINSEINRQREEMTT